MTILFKKKARIFCSCFLDLMFGLLYNEFFGMGFPRYGHIYKVNAFV
jgi:hypothetical protein